MIIVKDLKYRLYAVLSTGNTIELTKSIQSLTWSDNDNEIAQRANIKLANYKSAMGYLTTLLELCTHIYIKANWGTGFKKVFKGTLWDYNYASATQKDLTIVAYDKMIYMQKSKEDSYYPKGTGTEAGITDIAKRWNVNFKYEWKSIPHEKMVFKNSTIVEEIYKFMSEAAKQLKEKAVALMVEDTLYIRAKGTNKDIYILNTKNTISTDYRISMDNLVTKIIIVAADSDGDRSSVISSIEGKTEYGILQEIVTKSSNATLEEARKEAETILEERGKPLQSITINSPDIPPLRKGDKLRVEAGNLIGDFYIKAVTHDFSEKSMQAELELTTY
jgi:hypothetical protein